MDENDRLRVEYETAIRKVNRTARIQKLWWFAVLLLGAGLGFALAEYLIDPVTVLVPPCEGIRT